MKRFISRSIAGFVVLLCCCLDAQATNSYNFTQTSPAPPALIVMGTNQTITYTVTNTSNGTDINERLYQVRIRLKGACTGSPCTFTTFSATTVAPPGWSYTIGTSNGCSTCAITFTANSAAYALSSNQLGSPPTPTTLNFNVVLTGGTSNQDRNESDTNNVLRDVRARFTLSSAPPFNNNGSITKTTGLGSWRLYSLLVTLTPSATTVSKSCSAAFTLTMSVTNKATVSISNVTSVPKPPQIAATGGASASTTSAPANFNLNTGASNSFVWTYTTGNNTGTLTFNAYAADNNNNNPTHTSPMVYSPVITVANASCLIATFTAPPAGGACVFNGDTATFTMQVTNNTTAVVSNVQPSTPTKGGSASIGTLSGPTPASIASLAIGASGTFTWMAPITGNVDDTYTLTALASGDGGATQSLSVTSDSTADIKGYLLQITPNPVNASSINQELAFQLTNHACSSVNKVSIPVTGLVPAGWVWNSDSYSLVQTSVGNYVETWTAALNGSNVEFTAPVGSEMPTGLDSYFYLTYTTPTSTGTTTFNLTITDTAARAKPTSDTVTVNTFNTGSPNPNYTSPDGTWREPF